MKKHPLPILLAIASSFASILSPSSADAALYGATGSSATNGELYTLNPANGAVLTDVGPLVDSLGNPYALTGLRFNTITGLLYGSTSSKSATDPGFLITVDPATALVTPIGSFGLIFPYRTMSDLAFDSTSGNMYAVGANNTNFYSVNQLTGAATLIGANVISAQTGGGLAANSAGTIYGEDYTSSDKLYTYNKTTGSATLVADSGPAVEFNALAFDSADTLYGVDKITRDLFTIDTTSGAVTDLGFTAANMDALAFELPSVPEPSTTFFGALAAFTVILRRNRDRRNA
jgi:hypothetical protein